MHAVYNKPLVPTAPAKVLAGLPALLLGAHAVYPLQGRAPVVVVLCVVERAAAQRQALYGHLGGIIPTNRMFQDPMNVSVVEGDLLDQDVDAIVNAWNRNIFPWWLLLPQGVSGAIKRRGGLAPFRELRRFGVLPLGGAVLTSAGRLPFKGIIHVAGIGLDWRASPESVEKSVTNALALATTSGFGSVALPLIGAGTGSLKPDQVCDLMLTAIRRSNFHGAVKVVRYGKV